MFLARLPHRHLTLARKNKKVLFPTLLGQGYSPTAANFSTADGGSKFEDDDAAEEAVAETGEWAGCRRSFMTPLRISVRGSDTIPFSTRAPPSRGVKEIDCGFVVSCQRES
jgi:hypothetical protein